MEYPLVSIICICYNHQQFVEKCINSVYTQTYNNFELIVCDDFSTDNSVEILNQLHQKFNFKLIINKSNIGNCKTFNKALAVANGKYVIDLAADDLILSNSLVKRIKHFENQNINTAFTYSDSIYIDENDQYKFTFSELIKRNAFPEGDIFKALFEGRFICPTTVIFKKSFLDQLGGYDDNLSYEDFDIWMRLARNFSVSFFNDVTFAKRVVAKSSSTKFYSTTNNVHLKSTLIICNKALELALQNEKSSVNKFVQYHFKLSYFTSNFEIAYKFYDLMDSTSKRNKVNKFIKLLLDKNINISPIYTLYLKFRLKDLKL